MSVQAQSEVRRILRADGVGRDWVQHPRSNQPKDFLDLFRFFVPESGSFSLRGIRPPPTFCTADCWRGWREKGTKTQTWKTGQKTCELTPPTGNL